METLAYTHLYEAREVANLDPEAYELKLFEGVNWKRLPNSAWMGLLGIAVLLSSLSPMLPASALRANPPGGCLNARYGPGTQYGVYTCVRRGAALKPVVARRGSWLQLSSGRWVYGPYTTAGGGSGGGRPVSNTIRVATNGSRLNIRSGPSIGYRAIGSLGNGTVIRTSGRASRGWIQLSGGGWVSSAYARYL